MERGKEHTHLSRNTWARLGDLTMVDVFVFGGPRVRYRISQAFVGHNVNHV